MCMSRRSPPAVWFHRGSGYRGVPKVLDRPIENRDVRLSVLLKSAPISSPRGLGSLSGRPLQAGGVDSGRDPLLAGVGCGGRTVLRVPGLAHFDLVGIGTAQGDVHR